MQRQQDKHAPQRESYAGDDRGGPYVKIKGCQDHQQHVQAAFLAV